MIDQLIFSNPIDCMSLWIDYDWSFELTKISNLGAVPRVAGPLRTQQNCDTARQASKTLHTLPPLTPHHGDPRKAV
jgi:hypothetical protein